MTVEPSAPGFRSDAEREVWNALRHAIGPEDVLLTNVRVTDETGDHEGDLIVGIVGAGIAVIEVKGGRVAHNGTDWVQHGGVSKPIDPVGQSRRAKYALRSYLDSRSAWDGRRVRMAHLVAFPYSTVPRDLSLPECPRWLVLDKNDLAHDPLGAVRHALSSQETTLPAADASDIAALANSVRPAIVTPDATPVITRPRRSHWRWIAATSVAALALVGSAGLYLARTAEGTDAGSGLDPRFATCLQAKAAGYGMYQKDRDPEYAWYRDLDRDGLVCE